MATEREEIYVPTGNGKQACVTVVYYEGCIVASAESGHLTAVSLYRWAQKQWPLATIRALDCGAGYVGIEVRT